MGICRAARRLGCKNMQQARVAHVTPWKKGEGTLEDKERLAAIH